MGVICTRATNGEDLEDLPLHMQVEHVLSVARSRGLVANPPERAQQSHVRLNIYDTKRDNSSPIFWPKAEGSTFHCGLEVYNCEWSYGSEERQWGLEWSMNNKAHPTGITCYVPRDSIGHRFCEFVPLGKTLLSEDEVLRSIQRMGKAWLASEWDNLTRSCLHFTDALCQALGLGGLPEQVKRMATEEAQGSRGCGISCCGHTLCACNAPSEYLTTGSLTSSRAAGDGSPDVSALKRQLEHTTVQLQRAQNDLARERAYHDDAIRQVLELRRAAGGVGSEGSSQCFSPRSPNRTAVGASQTPPLRTPPQRSASPGASPEASGASP